MRAEIINELDALSTHYPRGPRSPDQHMRFLEDYLDDLEGFSPSDVKAACRRWRQSEATKFPTSGQLMTVARQERPPEHVDGTAWHTPTDAEYEAMDLEGKIRHHLIMAHRASTEAGPMFRNGPAKSWREGEHLTEDQMPPAWHEKREVAKRHTAEAKRLREFLKGKRS